MRSSGGWGRSRSATLLYLTDDLGGGTGNHLLSVAGHCHGAGWDVEVVSFAPKTARRRPDLPVGRLPTPPGPAVYPVRQVARFRQVRRLVRDRDPDLLHAYFFWPVLYGRLLRMLGSVPILVENREDEGFNWGRHEYAWLRATRRAPDRIVCVSEAVREVVREREAVIPGLLDVVHNGVEEPGGVDPGRVAGLRRELSLPDDAPVVGMVANLTRAVKGVDRFLEAVAAIVDEVPAARFLVVGERGGRGDDLRRRAGELGVGDSVQFVGYREDVEAFYELMDVSVLTSRTEGLSITLLESMSHGVPVVATRVGGNPEIVAEGRSGFLVPLTDVGRLAERVVRLLRDGDLRSRMGAAARRRVRANFRLQDTVRRYEELYRSLLEAQTAS